MATRRSHPPTLETLTRRLILEDELIGPDMTVLVAISGGPDSMALLHVLARLSAKMNFTLCAHGVDHGLRREAASELGLAASLAASLGVPMGVTQVEVRPGGNLQARAREARWGALRAAAASAGAQRIATGHHADDRAETVLMRLLQGSGPRGLACMRSREHEVIRPMLRARREDVLAHVTRHRVVFATDPSNTNSRFLRARVRGEVMPLLRALSPSVVEHLNTLADELQHGCFPGADGELGTAQRRQVERAQRSGQRGAKVRLAGGRDAWVTVAEGRTVISYERLAMPSTGAGVERASTTGRVGGSLEVTQATSTPSVVEPSKARP